MQTFLPFADFRASAEVLDDKRLGKQRVETLQVMRALTLPDYGWQHHPVVAMWRGYRPALMAYQDATCAVWLERGHADTCLAKTLIDLERSPEDFAAYERGDYPIPPWNADEAVHRSHRSKLVQKDREHYRPLFPDAPDDLDYVWPVPSAAAAVRRSASSSPRRAG
ncbi:MSMEG_6728 family protein [Curtobacterium sp. 9128]|uniref:MSMEG_6728 family protein n=1 Tax=Curtobacterium sp. 9128 TaxID=1793722 RepID=UPI0011A9DF82|nr:MSMEG_6728 family protein [Curtobacterium sp. 9128]